MPDSPRSRGLWRGWLARLSMAVVLCALVWCAWWKGLLDPLQGPLLDEQWRWLRDGAPTAVANDVTVVAFDDAFLQQAPEPFALYHGYLAQLLQAFESAGPALVAFDIALPEKSYFGFVPRGAPDYDYDRVLLRALGLAGRRFPILLARTMDEDQKRLRDVHVDFIAIADRSVGLQRDAGSSASAVLCPDADLVVRRYPGAWCNGAGTPEPLAAAMAGVRKNRQDWQGAINYRIGGPMRVIRAADVLAALQRGDTAWLKERLAGATVLVGLVTRDDDRHRAPVPLSEQEPLNLRASGVLLHAQIYRSLMNDGLIAPVGLPGEAMCAALGLICWLGRRSLARVLLYVLTCGGIAGVSVWLLQRNVLMPAGLALASVTVGLLASLAFDAARNWRERLQLRLAFGGYASPLLMRQIESGEVSPDSDGARGHVCVLFADIRDFTRMSEQMAPEEVMRVLNVFLGEMTQIVHDHGGIVDKFIGDSLMAIFGQPVSVSRPEQAAMEAAHAMLLRLQQLNSGEFAARKLELVMGVGIHAGDAVLGYVGSRERHDFTAIGDTVNIAARLESLSKSLGVPIVCSGTVARRAGMPSFLRDMGEQGMRGHAPMHVYGWSPLAEVAPQAEVQIHATAPA